jgi:hypothetical protein
VRPPDALEALIEVAAAFDEMGIRWYIGGSVASSARGVARASLDVDVVAELRHEHAVAFARRLRSTFYVDEESILDALRHRSSFNMVHLPTALKVDVFAPRDRPFDRAALSRAVREPLDLEGTGPAYPVATSEDVVISKLEWFRDGGEVSERQWTDVLGVLRIAGDAIDRAYLERTAASLGLSPLLERALRASKN